MPYARFSKNNTAVHKAEGMQAYSPVDPRARREHAYPKKMLLLTYADTLCSEYHRTIIP